MLLDTNEFSTIKKQKTLLQPGLDGGYSAIYHNKIPMDLKFVDYDRNVKQVGGAQMLSVKLYSFGSKINSAKLKLQIESDYDPFLSLIFQCDSDKYGYMKQQQGLKAQFQQFSTILIKCFNKIEQQCCCRTQQTTNMKGKLTLNLLIGSDGKAKLIINQTSDYKNIQIIILDLLSQNQQITQEKVTFKYQQLQNKVKKTQERLAKIQQIIKLKNPTLLTQIYKTTHGQQQGKLNINGI